MRVRLNHKRLLELIGQSKLSQNHWAIRLGLSRGHWSGIVHGKHPYPSRKTRTVLLEAFGVPFDQLFIHESHTGVDAAFQADLADRYLLEKEIGQGGMGTVYLARDVRLARSVALKVVSTEAVSGIGVEQFLKEIRYTARLQHHHILPVHDAGEAAGAPYYVMPFIEGGSLRRRLDLDGALDLDRVVLVAGGIGAALRYAHDRQVLHCDVKPENVLLSGDHPFVADFGIARAIRAEGLEWGRRTELDSSAGTPAYVSPEQASGERSLDARSDVYSLACLTFEMLAGRPPFEGRTTMETVAKRFVEYPRLARMAPHVPRAVAEVVETAMHVNPDARPPSSTAFAHELRRATQPTSRTPLSRITAPFTRTLSIARRVLLSTPISVVKPMETLHQDLRFAFRTFRRSPLLALVIIVTLALGIGINSAVFTVVSGVLLRPLPYDDAERLVLTWNVVRRGSTLDTTTMNPLDVADYRSRSVSFTDMAAFNVWLPTVSGDREAERVRAGIATRNFFDVVGVQPVLGSGFTGDHDDPGDNRVVVISHGFWQRWYGGDPDVLSRTLTVNGETYDVVGVMPSEYRHVDPSRDVGDAEFWAPISVDGPATDRSSLYLRVIARLRPNVSIQQASAEVAGIARQLEMAHPQTNANRSAVVVSLRAHHYRAIRPALLTVFAGGGLVLLIVCANIANLVLARSQSRRREFAVRTSLGAGRHRLVRQLIVEQTALTMVGAVVGLGIVMLGARGFAIMQDSFLSRIAVITVDGRVVLFTMGIALVVGLVFGLVPVAELQRNDMRELLSDETAGSGSSRATHRFRTGLVISQIGLAVALLIGAGLLTRSFINLVRVPTGFRVDNILTFETTAPRWRYESAQDAATFFMQLASDLKSIPSVEAVGMISDLPFTSENRFQRFNRLDDPFPSADAPSIEYHQIDDGYLDAAGITVVAGRGIRATDRGDAPSVIVVNESAAAWFWPEQGVLGMQLVLGRNLDDPRATVVGVVADVLDDGLNSQPEPRVYLPYLQSPAYRMSTLIRSAIDPGTLAAAARARVRALDAQAPVGDIATFRELVAESVAGERMAVRLATWFSVLSVALAAVGIYGLMAFIVGTRRREIGIRSALGAESGDVLRFVLAQSVRFTVAGVLLGLALGAVVTRLVSSLLFGVAPMDPITFIGAPVLLGGIALLASYLPARRASRITPMLALRAD